MKVYLVDVDNGESWEDYRHEIEAVFSTYRGASQWLIDRGYEPFHTINHKDEDEVQFSWEESDEYMGDYSTAKIIERLVVQ